MVVVVSPGVYGHRITVATSRRPRPSRSAAVAPCWHGNAQHGSAWHSIGDGSNSRAGTDRQGQARTPLGIISHQAWVQ